MSASKSVVPSFYSGTNKYHVHCSVIYLSIIQTNLTYLIKLIVQTLLFLKMAKSSGKQSSTKCPWDASSIGKICKQSCNNWSTIGSHLSSCAVLSAFTQQCKVHGIPTFLKSSVISKCPFSELWYIASCNTLIWFFVRSFASSMIPPLLDVLPILFKRALVEPEVDDDDMELFKTVPLFKILGLLLLLLWLLMLPLLFLWRPERACWACTPSARISSRESTSLEGDWL